MVTFGVAHDRGTSSVRQTRSTPKRTVRSRALRRSGLRHRRPRHRTRRPGRSADHRSATARCPNTNGFGSSVVPYPGWKSQSRKGVRLGFRGGDGMFAYDVIPQRDSRHPSLQRAPESAAGVTFVVERDPAESTIWRRARPEGGGTSHRQAKRPAHKAPLAQVAPRQKRRRRVLPLVDHALALAGASTWLLRWHPPLESSPAAHDRAAARPIGGSHMTVGAARRLRATGCSVGRVPWGRR